MGVALSSSEMGRPPAQTSAPCVARGEVVRHSCVARPSQGIVRRCSRFEHSETAAALKLKWYIHWRRARRRGGRAGLGREMRYGPMGFGG